MSAAPHIADESDDDRVVDEVVDSLSKKFPDVAESVITAHVEEALAPMVDAPIQEYVSVLVEHQVQTHLIESHQDAEAGSDPADDVPPDHVA